MLNKILLIGRIGQSPEVRRLESGAVVAKFSVATNENYKDKSGEWQTQTEWHDVICWRQLAEKAETSLEKGDQVYVEGKLTHRTWQDKDGNNRKTTEVVANYFRRINSRGEVEEVAPNVASSTVAPIEPENKGDDAEEDDLPF